MLVFYLTSHANFHVNIGLAINTTHAETQSWKDQSAQETQGNPCLSDCFLQTSSVFHAFFLTGLARGFPGTSLCFLGVSSSTVLHYAHDCAFNCNIFHFNPFGSLADVRTELKTIDFQETSRNGAAEGSFTRRMELKYFVSDDNGAVGRRFSDKGSSGSDYGVSSLALSFPSSAHPATSWPGLRDLTPEASGEKSVKSCEIASYEGRGNHL